MQEGPSAALLQLPKGTPERPHPAPSAPPDLSDLLRPAEVGGCVRPHEREGRFQKEAEEVAGTAECLQARFPALLHAF